MSRRLGFAFIVSGFAVGGAAVSLQVWAPSAPAPSIFTFGVTEIAKAHAAVPERPSTPALAGPGLVLPEWPAPRPVGMPLQPLAPTLVPEPVRKPIGPFHTTIVPNEPVSLTRALQRELTRVGCYAGPVHGIWTTASREAMRSFNRRINAKLPLGKPDQVLLALVQAQRGRICGAGCPDGQMTDAHGRCLPAALVLKTRRAPAAIRTAAVEPAGVRPEKDPFVAEFAGNTLWLGEVGRLFADTQRMGLAGPLPDDAPNAVEEPKPHVEASDKSHKRQRERHKTRHRKAHAPYGQTKWAREFWANQGSGS